MSRSIFGWSLPPGCRNLPGEEPEYVQPHCTQCGGFLKDKPDSTSYRSYVMTDCGDRLPLNQDNIKSWRVIEAPWGDDPWYEWSFETSEIIRHHICKRCGHDNQFGEN